MIKIENVVTPSPEQWKSIIMGMRNPLNSWNRSDSQFWPEHMQLGENDKDLMKRLADGGPVHAKYRRMITVYADITAPLYWWKEFDTYKVGTAANSCSTMHKITDKEFALEDFSREHLNKRTSRKLLDIINELNFWRDAYCCESLEDRGSHFADSINWNDTYIPTKKECWYQMIQILPSSYNQRRTVMMNYEVLCNIYHSRKGHKLEEWNQFCSWIEKLPNFELITGERNVSERED